MHRMLSLLLALSCTHPLLAQTGRRIEGVVVNGSKYGRSVAGAEVVLRAGIEGALQPVAQTTTDGDGRFVFDRLPVEPEWIFLPGANHQGVHYPGPRLRLPADGIVAPAKVVVFDAVQSPSPLVAELHEIDVRVRAGSLEVTETLRLCNPSLTTYVGQAGRMPMTLAIAIPDGFERVTFHDEFNGRRFKLLDNRLVTDIPWTPGKREVKFTYHLPVEEGGEELDWSLSVPCALVRLRVHGENADRVASNLGPSETHDGSTRVFESAPPGVAADQRTTLQLGGLPTAWIVYLRWSALGILAALILATALLRLWRRPAVPPMSEGKAGAKQRSAAQATRSKAA